SQRRCRLRLRPRRHGAIRRSPVAPHRGHRDASSGRWPPRRRSGPAPSQPGHHRHLRQGRPCGAARARAALAGSDGMTPLASALAEYLTVRRRLGFKLGRHGQLLRDFVAYLDEREVTTVTTELALAWARWPTGASPSWWGARLSVVRVFAR